MDPSLLIILIFVVAPLIEKLLKAGKQGQKPPLPRQRPSPRIERRTERDLPGRGIDVRIPPAQREEPARRDSGSAAEVLPDELWEILTGERRTTPPATPLPEPAYGPGYEPGYEPAYEGNEAGYEPEQDSRETLPPEPTSLEQESAYESRLDYESRSLESRPSYDDVPVLREPTRVISLEQTSFDDRARHRQFHERMENLPPAARVRRPHRARLAGLRTDADLRRAIIMTEILGPPRGL